jgi:hypothetical protein
MAGITIQLPPLDAEHTIEIDVRVNGKKKTYTYRVEIMDWEDCEEPTEIRVECLRRMINDYGKDWQLVQIGNPTETNIPVMFRKVERTAKN